MGRRSSSFSPRLWMRSISARPIRFSFCADCMVGSPEKPGCLLDKRVLHSDGCYANALDGFPYGDLVTAVPEIRVRSLNDAPVRMDGEYVLYWMIAFRRLGWNFALERAAEVARELGRPL